MEIADPVPKKKRLPPYVYDRAGRRIRVISTPYVVSLNEGQKRSQPSQTPSHPNGLLGPQAEKASTSTSCDRTGELPSNNGENIDIAGVETRSMNPEKQSQPQEQAYTSIMPPPPSSSSLQSSTPQTQKLPKLINIQPVATPSKFNAKLKTYLRTPDGKRIRIETRNVQILDKAYASV